MARGGPAEASSSPPFPSTVSCPLVPPIIPKHPAAACRHCEETARTSTRGEREGAAVERSQPVRRERSTSRTIGLLARGRREQYLSLRVSNNIRLPARICCPDGFVCSATFPPLSLCLKEFVSEHSATMQGGVSKAGTQWSETTTSGGPGSAPPQVTGTTGSVRSGGRARPPQSSWTFW